jgi:transposase
MSTYDREFKFMAVELLNSGKSSSQVARELGIGHDSAKRWKIQFESESATSATSRMGNTDQELIRLKKELREVKLERDILKKVVRIFSKNDGTNSDL